MPRTPPQLATRLPGDASALALARGAVDSFELSPGVREDARLIVSELVANAVRHGHGTVTLLLSRARDGSFRGEVVDDGAGFQPRERAAGLSQGGWGPAIVDRLAETWGVARGAARVWFQLPREAALGHPVTRA
jgi:anti-sigma regulatory factor (Ser/Thr protein kinase)